MFALICIHFVSQITLFAISSQATQRSYLVAGEAMTEMGVRIQVVVYILWPHESHWATGNQTTETVFYRLRI